MSSRAALVFRYQGGAEGKQGGLARANALHLLTRTDPP